MLETVFTTAEGSVAVIDFMPIREGVPSVIRVVEGRSGTVRMHTDLRLRFDYGSIVPWVRRIDGGIVAVGGARRRRAAGVGAARRPGPHHGRRRSRSRPATGCRSA